MARIPCSDEEFLLLFEKLGPYEAAKKLGISRRGAFKKRAELEQRLQITISPPPLSRGHRKFGVSYPAKLEIEAQHGTVLIGSDPHCWPGDDAPAWRAFVAHAKEAQPQAIVLSGDIIDGARISRFPPIGYAEKPTLRAELDEVDARLHELRLAAQAAKLYWILGNHDLRFENRLAYAAPEFGGIEGFSLRDQFPAWTLGISARINNSVVIKHRFKGGIHAPFSNTLYAGLSIVTAHHHALQVIPFSDYRGTRWGVDAGTLANPTDPQFEYTEDNPLNWRRGHILLSFVGGELLWPEVSRIVEIGGRVYSDFRGQLREIADAQDDGKLA
jgi:hypothetical protein